MKITQSQLRKIIKEELESILEEGFDEQTGMPLDVKSFQACMGNPQCAQRLNEPLNNYFFETLTKNLQQQGLGTDSVNIIRAILVRALVNGVGVNVGPDRFAVLFDLINKGKSQAKPQAQAQAKPQAQAAGSTAAEIDQQIDALKQEFRKQLAKDPNNREEYSAEFKKQIRALAQKKAAAQR